MVMGLACFGGFVSLVQVEVHALCKCIVPEPITSPIKAWPSTKSPSHWGFVHSVLYSLSLFCRSFITFSSALNGVKVKFYGVNAIVLSFDTFFTCVVLLKNHCIVFQESLDVMSTNDDNTLGFTLELYSRYMEAARVCKISVNWNGSPFNFC